MAKRRKTKTLVWDDEIEQLWATVREHSRRMDGIELGAANARFGVSGLSDEALDKLIKEAMEARPWYAKVAAFGHRLFSEPVLLSVCVITVLIVVVVVIAR